MIRASDALGRMVAAKQLLHVSDCLEDASYKQGRCYSSGSLTLPGTKHRYGADA